jgi:hypothetical protein
MKYLDLLNEKAEETAKANNVLVAETAQLNVAQKTLACKKQLAALNVKLAEYRRAKDFNPESIFATHNAIELTKREIAFYEELNKELF